MQGREAAQTLKTISSFEDVINAVSERDLDISTACKTGINSIRAWCDVMDEFNDVISTLEGSEKPEDRIYRAAFGKALEIVMIANRYRKYRRDSK